MAAVKGAKAKRVAEVQAQEVLGTVKGMTFDTVTRELAGVQVELQKTLAELSGKLAEQWQVLEQVQDAIGLKHEELAQLHQIEVKAHTLDELEAQIKDTRENWGEEEAQWKRDFEQMKSEQRKQWTREQEDYKYTLEQKQRKQEDTLQMMFEQKEKANRDKQELLDKQWAEREEELKKREQELVELRKMKEEQPDVIRKASNADVAIATNSLKKEYEHKMVILQKDAEMEKRLAESNIASQQQNIEKLTSQIADLRQQMEQAHQRVSDISTKAFDSVSGRSTTEALQRLMESEKMQGKGQK